jgi:beta-glucosidase/6-phospho-beta-glucosidase/beta-galactosidase
MATYAANGRHAARPDGWNRPAFLRAHIAELLEAARRGAPVVGYLHWTLVDNYEWGSYAPRFGPHGVDRRGGPLILDTDSNGDDAAAAYREIVEALRSGDGPQAALILRS